MNVTTNDLLAPMTLAPAGVRSLTGKQVGGGSPGTAMCHGIAFGDRNAAGSRIAARNRNAMAALTSNAWPLSPSAGPSG